MTNFWIKVDKTLRYHGRRASRKLRTVAWALSGSSAERPVFVIGCSRAGTTLVYKTFSESKQLGTLQRETHDFWSELHPPEERHWDTHALSIEQASDADKRLVSRYFYIHTGKRRFVDKNNQNGLSILYLYALFPDAHFIYVKRSPGDNLQSLIQGWGKADEFATWSDKLPAEVMVDSGQYARWCFFLADGWRQYLRSPIEEVCAFQYRAMNEAILTVKPLIPDAQWTEIRYEDLLNDPVAGFEQAFSHCGLDFNTHLRHHCADVLARPYNAFSEIRVDKWRDGPHCERIKKVLPQVSAVAQKMGYDV